MPQAQSPHTGRWWRVTSGSNAPMYPSMSGMQIPHVDVVPWPVNAHGVFYPEEGIAGSPVPTASPAMPQNYFGDLPSFESNVSPKAMTPNKKKQRLYNIPLIEAFSGKLSNKAQEGEVGIEIECEGMNLFNAPIQFWGVHSDGSLRMHGDHPPVEYVLRKPLPREDIPKALTYLSKKLKEAGSEIDESVRTSVHVHLNCQTLSMKEVTKIWCLYTIFEELLVNFSGASRVGNLFCLRSKDAEHQIQIYEQALQNENYSELFSDNLRYTSCNTASLGKFGSLEFRSMRGTVDQGLIQLWVDTLLLIKDKALTYKDPTDIVTDFQEKGPEEFLENTFKGRSDIRSIFGHSRDYHKPLWDGLRLMRDVAYAVKWEAFDPKLKVEKKGRGRFSQWVTSDYGDITAANTPNGLTLLFNGDTFYLINENTNNIAFTMPGGRNTVVGGRSGYRYDRQGRYMESGGFSLDD